MSPENNSHHFKVYFQEKCTTRFIFSLKIKNPYSTDSLELTYTFKSTKNECINEVSVDVVDIIRYILLSDLTENLEHLYASPDYSSRGYIFDFVVH